MTNSVLLIYCAIASAFFLIGIILGKVLKKDVLHGGVELGIFNSFYLSSVWPITILSIFAGWGYDMVQEWKKL